jgi:hypothetical protein
MMSRVDVLPSCSCSLAGFRRPSALVSAKIEKIAEE